MSRSHRHALIVFLGLGFLLAVPIPGSGDARAEHVRANPGSEAAPPVRRVRAVPARHGQHHVILRVRRLHCGYPFHCGPLIRVGIGGGFYFRYATPPPPPVDDHDDYDYDYEPPPPPVAQAVVHAPPPRPLRFGLGAFAGTVRPEDQESGSDLGLLGRFRLSERFELEAELSRTSLADDLRIDRRVGAALLFDLAPRGRLSPYLLGGLGFGRAELGGGQLTAAQGYAELGAGLTYRFSPRFHMLADLRAGERKNDADGATFKSSSSAPILAEDERYVRGRIGLLVYF